MDAIAALRSSTAFSSHARYGIDKVSFFSDTLIANSQAVAVLTKRSLAGSRMIVVAKGLSLVGSSKA